LTVRGRPALAVLDGKLAALDEIRHPGNGVWRALLATHQRKLLDAANATGALKVRDLAGQHAPWVQGTAWLIRPDLVITNRHVLFPDLGMRLAQRLAVPRTTAKVREGLELLIDFAYDDGPRRTASYKVSGIDYVSENQDPVDVAVLRIQPADSANAPLPQALQLLPSTVIPEDIYVVGHPSQIRGLIPAKVLSVFGTPDGRKRVSFGKRMAVDASELTHDASTIEGYSGGCVLPFMSTEVAALHYGGDPITGNQAILAQALLRHPVAQFFEKSH
jgi:hypothetical protein